MDDIYQENILDHYKNPRNFGELEGKDVIKIREMNASCGDLIEISVKFSARRSPLAIADIRFKGIGCALSTAAASLLTEKIKKQELKVLDVQKLKVEDIKKLLGIKVSPTREKCVRLSLAAIQKAIEENLGLVAGQAR